ncbi:MAG: ethanolamine ammonia-lyase reactivating factor EutA, partial [Oscillospiraceae bacterium]|nr:ethanolamine ammonia-lyase reactivating factor EutA [Oscillospiraceae bacterium]
FSGGVADLIGPEPRPDLAYGDLGVLLGRAIHRSRLCRAGQYRRAAETIRATVIGAGSHSTELSGSTIFYQGMDFPMKNLPVAALSPAEEAQEPAALGRTIRSRLSMVAPEGPAVLGLQGRRNPKFSELCKLADGLAEGLAPRAGAGQPLIVAVEADMGKALGQALQMLLPGTPLLCLDGVRIPPESYLDIGAPVAGGQALPVVVKTLVL